jgi:hypothetical protein
LQVPAGAYWRHEEATHSWFVAHAIPQPPQSSGPVSFTQAAMLPTGQPVAFPTHVCLHLPAEQASPATQLLPQAPQFRTSLSVSTHLPPQSTSPARQTHAPFEHC